MPVSPEKISAFRRTVWNHYRRHGRHMPWRETRDPYRILVSEYMLQQTQVDRVIPKYQSFLIRFPTVISLAQAPLADVLRKWQGLGYNRRGLYLKRAAEEIVSRHGSTVPHDAESLSRFPGIGPGTAGAIAAFAFQKPSVFIETNIRRVFIHFFFPRRTIVSDTDIMPLIAASVSRKNPREWYYALMDYGAYLARRVPNPNRQSRHYAVQSRFEGSHRQLRGKILTAVLAEPSLTPARLAARIATPLAKVTSVYNAMKKEGILT